MTSSENPNNEHKEYKKILVGLILCNTLWYILSLIIIFTNLWTKTLAKPVAISVQTMIANATVRLNTPSTEIRKTTVTIINIDNLYWQCLFLKQSRWETGLFFLFLLWELLGIIGKFWEILGIIGNYWESELCNCCTFAPDFEIQAIVTLIQMISIYPN